MRQGRTGQPLPLVRLLEADPELGRGLAPQDTGPAAQHALAEMLVVDVGHYPGNERDLAGRPDLVGLLVLAGVVARAVSTSGSTSIELLGAGDVMCPTATDDEDVTEEVVVLQQARLAVLDHSVFSQVRHWPVVGANLLVRACGRSHRLSLQLAISHMVGLERRILALLWHFAYRWGNVTADGVLLPLRLTNRQLGNIVGASDPSVSTAVTNLARQGRIRRVAEGTWLPLTDDLDLAGGRIPVTGAATRDGDGGNRSGHPQQTRSA